MSRCGLSQEKLDAHKCGSPTVPCTALCPDGSICNDPYSKHVSQPASSGRGPIRPPAIRPSVVYGLPDDVRVKSKFNVCNEQTGVHFDATLLIDDGAMSELTLPARWAIRLGLKPIGPPVGIKGSTNAKGLMYQLTPLVLVKGVFTRDGVPEVKEAGLVCRVHKGEYDEELAKGTTTATASTTPSPPPSPPLTPLVGGGAASASAASSPHPSASPLPATAAAASAAGSRKHPRTPSPPPSSSKKQGVGIGTKPTAAAAAAAPLPLIRISPVRHRGDPARGLRVVIGAPGVAKLGIKVVPDVDPAKSHLELEEVEFDEDETHHE